jgi:hypothetical protein
MPIVDEYNFTTCAEEAIKTLYPRSKEKGKHMAGQRQLQAALIRCHLFEMEHDELVRAEHTLKYLDAGMVPIIELPK